MPEAAVAPAPTPAPAGVIESAPKTSVDTFPGLSADLDSIIGKSGLGSDASEQRAKGRGRKTAEPKPEKPKEEKAIVQVPDKPETKPEAKPETKPESKEEPKPEDKSADKPPEKPTETAGEKALGPWQRTHAAERKVKELEAKVQELSNRKPTDDPEKLEIQKRHDDIAKKYKELDDEIRYINYEKSSEFQEKHHKPYIGVWKDSIAAIADFTVNNADGTTRAATAQDLESIVAIGNNKQALAKAEELFGSAADAAFVTKLRADIISAHRSMEAAKQDYRAKGEERFKAWEAEQTKAQQEQTKQQEHYQSLWKQFNEAALEQHKDWFVAEEGDEEGKELLAKGFELADLAWNGSDKLDPEKLIALRSAERNKAAAFRYMVHKNEKANARIAELEKQLKDYQDSEPGEGAVESDKKSEGYDIDAAIAKIPRA
jgi:hypothetical protein